MPAEIGSFIQVWKGAGVSKNRRLERRCSDSALGLDRSSNEVDRLLYHRFGGFGRATFVTNYM
jgi:hypothetical protein